jgi:hypothetical protein
LTEQILNLAKTISGAADTEESLLELLCAAAAREWEERLREGLTAEDCGEAFLCAAALSAVAALAASRAGGERVSSFKAGEVSVSENSAAEAGVAAGALRAQAESLMVPFIRDDRFCVRGVKG